MVKMETKKETGMVSPPEEASEDKFEFNGKEYCIIGWAKNYHSEPQVLTDEDFAKYIRSIFREILAKKKEASG